MAKHHGNEGVVKFETLAIGEIEAWSITDTAVVVTGRAMGETYQSATSTGGKAWSGNISGFLDEGDAGQAALLAGSMGAAQFYTDGEGSGKTEYSGSIVIGEFAITPDKDGYVKFSAPFTGNGALAANVLP